MCARQFNNSTHRQSMCRNGNFFVSLKSTIISDFSFLGIFLKFLIRFQVFQDVFQFSKEFRLNRKIFIILSDHCETENFLWFLNSQGYFWKFVFSIQLFKLNVWYCIDVWWLQHIDLCNLKSFRLKKDVNILIFFVFDKRGNLYLT